LAKKVPGCHGIKTGCFSLEEKLSIAQADSAEIADALASGMVKHHWVIHLGWNPHSSARTVLLKMNFINRPQINAAAGWRIGCRLEPGGCQVGLAHYCVCYVGYEHESLSPPRICLKL